MPVSTQTYPGAPQGMNRASAQHLIDDASAWTVVDGNLSQPGFIARRGPVAPFAANWTVASRRPVGMARTQNPAGAEAALYLASKTSSGGVAGIFTDTGSVPVEITWAVEPGHAPYDLYCSNDALNGGAFIGHATTIDKPPAASTVLALWKGASVADTTATQSGGSAQGDLTITVSSTASTASGQHLFNAAGRLVGVIKSRTNTILTLEHPALCAVVNGDVMVCSAFRGVVPRISKGRITGSDVEINGGGTKFKALGMGTGTWDVYTPDFTYLGTVTSVESDTQFHFTAPPTIPLLNADYVAIKRVTTYPTTGGQLGFLNAAFAGHQFYAKDNRLYFSDLTDPEAVDLTEDGDWLTFSSDPIRAIVPTLSALVVCTDKETYALVGAVGTTPDQWRGERILDDGTLCTMTAQRYKTGAVWAGRHGVWYWDGADPVNIVAKLGNDYMTDVAGFSSGTDSAYGMIVRDTYLCSIATTAGTFTSTKDQTSHSITRPCYVIDLGTGAISIFENVEPRGSVNPPESKGWGANLFCTTETTPKVMICQGDPLFDSQGQDSVFVEGGSRVSGTDASPDLYVETKKYDMSDPERLKLFKMLLLRYRAAGGNLKLDTIKGLDTAGTTSVSQYLSSAGLWINKRLKFMKRDQFIAFRLYQSTADGDVSSGESFGPATLAAGSGTSVVTQVGFDDHFDGSQWQITTSGAIAAGEKIVAIVVSDGDTVVTSGISSTNENPTWRNMITDQAGSALVSEMWEADGPLTSGSVVTGLNAGANHGVTILYKVTNVRNTGAVAAGYISKAQGASDNHSSGATASAASAGDAVLGYSHMDGDIAGMAPIGTFTQLDDKISDFFLFIQEVLVGWRNDLAGVATWQSTDSSASNPTYQAGVAVFQAATGTGTVTATAHGLVNGQVIYFTTTGGLMTGLVAGTHYYVVSKTTDTFKVAATQGGSPIVFSGSQSGVHTLHYFGIANTTAITLGTWAIGFKWKRPGRP